MEQLTQAPDPTFLLTIAGLAIAALLVLIIKLKVHAFASLTMVSLGTAIATGVPSEKVVSTMMGGFGGTLASVALLVGLGAMIGKILEVTGGAKVLADTLIVALVKSAHHLLWASLHYCLASQSSSMLAL